MKAVFVAFAMVLSLAAPAAATPAWEKLKEEIMNYGEPVNTQFGFYLVLTHKVDLPAPLKGHHVDYLSGVGYVDGGQFIFGRVDAVTETWKVNADGHWDIDQWIYVLTTEGRIAQGMHIHMVSDDGRILVHENLPLTDEERAAGWNRILNEWYKNRGISALP